MVKNGKMRRSGHRAESYDFKWEGGATAAEVDHDERAIVSKANPMLDVMSMGMDVFARQNYIYFHAQASKESVYEMAGLILSMNDEL